MSKDKKKIVILVVNKADQELKIFDNQDKLVKIIKKLKKGNLLFPDIDENKDLKSQIILISCKTQQGIKNLEQQIVNTQNLSPQVERFFSQDTQPDLFVSNLRHLELLKNALEEIKKTFYIDFLKGPELLVEHLKTAVLELQKITGGNLTEDVLDIIFSRFCVGK